MAPVVVIFDLSSVRSIWEGRVKKHKERQRKERERQERSALEKINEEWTQRLERRRRAIKSYTERGKDGKNGEMYIQMQHLKSKLGKNTQLLDFLDLTTNTITKDKRFIFELQGMEWKEVPESLMEKTYLREWHIKKTSIEIIPSFIIMFQDLIVMDLSRNCIKELPAEIGKMTKLKELNVSFNKLTSIPPELGNCENLEKLNLASNLNLAELPFEAKEVPIESMGADVHFCEESTILCSTAIECGSLMSKCATGMCAWVECPAFDRHVELLASFTPSQLRCVHPAEFKVKQRRVRLMRDSTLTHEQVAFLIKLRDLQKLSHLDLSSNQFLSMPICVLRMSNLKSLDLSSNKLKELPQDLDRLSELQSLFLQKNKMTYLSKVLCRMPRLKMLVVSGDDIKNLPSALLMDPNLKYIDLRENPLDSIGDNTISEIFEDDEREEFEKDLMHTYFQDLEERETAPTYTTRVSLSLQL